MGLTAVGKAVAVAVVAMARIADPVEDQRRGKDQRIALDPEDEKVVARPRVTSALGRRGNVLLHPSVQML